MQLTLDHFTVGNGYPVGVQSTVPLPPVGIFRRSTLTAMLEVLGGGTSGVIVTSTGTGGASEDVL